jgi:glutamate/tyrosine decarboxylase-like PLP-dependent enzyme
MPGTNLVCNMLLVNGRKEAFRCACSAGEHSYLFREEQEAHALDLGVGSVQCARRVDSLKWFLDWKYFGREGLAARVRHYLALAEYAEQRIDDTAALEMVVPRESFNVCFRYRPPQGTDINAFNLALRYHLYHQGRALVGVAWIGQTLALRLLITHPDFTEADVDRFLETVVAAGDALRDGSGGIERA